MRKIIDRVLVTLFMVAGTVGIDILLPRETGAQGVDAHWAKCQAIDPALALDGCTVVIQSAAETSRNIAGAFNNRGVAYDHMGQYDRAIQDFDEAIKLNSDYADAFYNRGVSYFHKGQGDRAIRDFDDATRLDPNDLEAFNNRGVAYAGKGQYDHAIQDFSQVIRLNPSAAAFLNRGLAYSDMARYESAVEDYDQAIRLDPYNATALYRRGLAKIKMGNTAGEMPTSRPQS